MIFLNKIDTNIFLVVSRLLCELVRKRERLKAEYTRVWERCVLHSLRPERAALHKLLRLLRHADLSDVFTEPVDLQEVRACACVRVRVRACACLCACLRVLVCACVLGFHLSIYIISFHIYIY